MHSNEQRRSFNLVMFVCSLMTNKLQLIAILTLTSILITGGFGLEQIAYSSGSSDNKKGDDKKVDVKNHDEDDDEHDDDDGKDDDDDDCKDDDEEPSTATITIFNSITRDNDRQDNEFVVGISPFTSAPGNDVDFAEEVTVNSGEPIMISLTHPSEFTRVLIAGDNCPAVSEFDGDNTATVQLKKGQHLICTVHHDDNFVEGQTGGEGIIFQHNSMQVKLSDKTALDSCDNADNAPPCIEIISSENSIIGIVDSALTADTTIVLFSVIEADRLDKDIGAINPVCSILAIAQHNKQGFFLKDPTDGSFPLNPTANNVVVLKCPEMIHEPVEDPNVDPQTVPKTMYEPIYNVNYALIDPTI